MLLNMIEMGNYKQFLIDFLESVYLIFIIYRSLAAITHSNRTVSIVKASTMKKIGIFIFSNIINK